MQTAYWGGELAAAAEAVREVLALYDPKRHHDLTWRYAQEDPGVAGRGHDAFRLWLTGSPARAAARAREVLELAESLEDPSNLALALVYALVTSQLLGDEAEVSRLADDLEALATEQGYGHWVAFATFFGGWPLAARGDAEAGVARMEQRIDGWRQSGSGLLVPYFLGLLAEARLSLGRGDAARSLLNEALALVERSGERWWEAELHRLAGEVLLAEGENAASEASFRRALEVARGQGARCLELRAAMSLSRLGRPDACRVLDEVVARFPEDLDTADLRAARAELAGGG